MRRAALAHVMVAVAVTVLVAACSSSDVPPSPSRQPVTTTSAGASGTAIPATVSVPASTPPATKEPAVPLAITSPAFAEGEPIPREFTCDGANVSPPLAWNGVPAGTAALALIVDDPDAGGFIHWVVYDIDPAVAGLAQAASTSTAGDALSQGQNSFGKVGYGGPCPPSGTHHYVFRLLALDQRVELRTGGGATAGRILAAAAGHTLAEARLTATYRRR